MLDKNDLQAIQELLNPIVARLDNLENKVDNLEDQVKLNTITVENAINQAIKVMGEGYQLNAERFDRLNIDAVKNKADIAFHISQLANEKVDRLIEQLNKSA